MKTKLTLNTLIVLLLITGTAMADSHLKDPVEKVSYSLGYQIGMDLKMEGSGVRPGAMLKGLHDGLSESDPTLEQEEMNRLLLDLKKKIAVSQKSEKKQAVEGYRGEGREFLAENAKKNDVIVLPSGLQYEVIKQGKGQAPGPDDNVYINYKGKTFTGQQFYDSRSDGKPDKVNVSGIVKGMSEALQLMKEGSHWQIFLPADLAYGERGPLADRAVTFDLELISVETGE